MEISKVRGAISTQVATSKNNGAVVQPLTPKVETYQASAVSHDCKLIEHAKAQLEQLPDIDTAKVAEIRQSLIDGSFDLDLDKLTDAMVQQHG